MKRPASVVSLLLLVVAGWLGFTAPSAVSAPRVRLPVIVVFRQDVSLEHGRRFFHHDDRSFVTPEAWHYLRHEVAGMIQGLELTHGFRADHIYSHAVRGFAARLTTQQIQALEQDPTVALIEADGMITTAAQVLPWGIDRINADASTVLAGNGSGALTTVRAYIIDTGIDTAHRDLNVVRHVNFAGGLNADCNGHGTHVAGSVAARDNTVDVVGAAPGVPLTGVKVLDCSGRGTVSNVIKGIDWVTANAVKPAVANMSLSGSASDALDAAIQRSVASGVFYAVAAGNSSANACGASPARMGVRTTGVMTVAATDRSNLEPSWSNFGSCVDVWAPGVGILSTRRGGGTTTMSGTSMASPHVAGTAALYLSRNPGASPATVESAIRANAVQTGTTSKDGRAITLDNAGGF